MIVINLVVGLMCLGAAIYHVRSGEINWALLDFVLAGANIICAIHGLWL